MSVGWDLWDGLVDGSCAEDELQGIALTMTDEEDAGGAGVFVWHFGLYTLGDTCRLRWMEFRCRRCL